MIRSAITQAITTALTSLAAEHVSFTLERPGQATHGDYATNAALIAASLLHKNPKDIAQELCDALCAQHIEGVREIVVAGNGFINFFLSNAALLREVEQAAGEKTWAHSAYYQGKRVLVEYTQPNPFKPFHIGHLMSNTLGESITRVLTYASAQVIRANYQGDVGPHVAKALYVLLQQQNLKPSIAEIGEAYVKGNQLYEEHQADKEAIDALNKKIYEHSDPQVNELYAWGKRISLEHFEELYRILGTKFDLYFFESETGPRGIDIVRAHPDVFEFSEGAIVFRGEPYGLHTRVFINSHGLPTYEAKDLGLIELKRERCAFDVSITVTASEQTDYFKVVLTAAQAIFHDVAGKYIHRAHGMMRFASGKMSSRKGNVITGESLLHDLQEAAKAKMTDRDIPQEQVAEEVAVGAVKYAILKQHSGKDMVFDSEKSLSLEGDSGPYVQYAHTRALSLIRTAHKAGIQAGITDIPEELGILERTLVHFPEVVERAAQELEPHYITTYLTELAGVFNSWYAHERVVGGTYPSYGLLLVSAVESVLRQGLFLLGMSAPEQM